MAQNITLQGASYSDVPSVSLPKTGGGTASFTDVTDTTATAADVAEGSYFYTSAGVRTAGTGSGGGVDTSQDTVDAAHLLDGYTAHDSNGDAITGEYVPPSPTLQAKTNISPTTSSQTIQADSGYDGLSSVQINAMPSGSVSASATKGSVSNHAISVTPTATVGTAGYLATGSTNGTAVSVSASELVSGTYYVGSSGTKDVTDYASVSVPALTLPTSSSSSAYGTRKSQITPAETTKYINISTGFNDTAQHYELLPMVLGTKSITENGTYYAEYDDLHGYSSVTVNVSGGGGSDVAVDVVEGASSSTSISFSNLKGEPTSFSLMCDGDIATGTPAKVAAVVYDGTDLHVQTITNTSNAQVTYVSSGFTKSYSNGTLTVSNSSASFAGDYYLVYTYDGGAGNVQTSDVQVGSGATSITFADLEDEPLCWYLIFKSNFSTSSGYQRVIFARYDGDVTEGMEMDSAAHSATHWSASYSNGSLTITSNGTNQGGYFHQPGYYQLTYAIAGDGGNYQSKTVTPTTSQQVVQADSGYDALKKVTVNAIPNTYVQPTSTVGATTYRASTSSQTINAGTYHSAAATIAAVSQTNLSAENIKSGTTISISNGQSNLWSVTGSYTGGGGSSWAIDSKTVTASNRPTSLSFTSMKGSPHAFFLRCTSSMSRSSQSSYYYVATMRYNGTNTTGNCWRMSNGNWTNITSGYSFTYSDTTLTVSSSGTTSSSPGCFYPGNYELVYVY